MFQSLITDHFHEKQNVINQVEIAPKRSHRIKGKKYLFKGETRIWNGKGWSCEHGRRKNTCKECGGASICEHGRVRNICKECGGSSICEHGRYKRYCKECGGASICEHGRVRNICKECGGASICEHGRHKSICKECGGSSIYEHGRHKSICKECGGSSICEHGRMRSRCKECNPEGHLTSLIRNRVYTVLKRYSIRKSKKTMEYVGCDVEILRNHIESQFLPLMTWENQGKWHIDHRKPCASFDLSIESERHKCFHYTNLQPLWGPDNISKSDSFDPDSFCFTWTGDSWIPISDD